MKQQTDVNSTTAPRRRTIASVALLLLGLPFATALVAIVKTSVNIPLTDDYDAIAVFLYRYVHTPGSLARIGWILTAQHTEYKLILLNTIVALQYHLIGHTNFRALQLLGDLSVPATVGLFWLLLARQQRPFRQAIWLMLVPAYLFLSLCYQETVNWATCGLQELTVIPLSIACVLFFTSRIRNATLWGTLFLILSVATFASSFILAVSLLIILIYQRRFKASLAVALAVCVMGAIYRVNYVQVPREHGLPPLGGALKFAFTFLGGLFPSLPACTALGVLLVAGFLFLLTRGWARLSPDTFCVALFCLITAAAIAPARYPEGLQTANTSRYTVYPLMLLSAEYLAALRIFVPQRLRLRTIPATVIGLATCAAMAFGIFSQMHAYRNLHARQRLLTTHLILWQRHPERLVLIPDEIGYFPGDRWIPFRIRAQKILEQSIASGLYIPPVSAADPLPVKPHSDSTLGIEDEPWPAKEAGAATNSPGRN
jgi:hypothetical protein